MSEKPMTPLQSSFMDAFIGLNRAMTKDEVNGVILVVNYKQGQRTHVFGNVNPDTDTVTSLLSRPKAPILSLVPRLKP